MMWKCFAAFLFIGAVTGYTLPLSRRQRLRSMLQDECALYGHGDAETVDKAEQAAITFGECFVGLIDLKELEQLGTTSNNMNDAIISLIQSSCNKKAEFMTCYNNLAESLSSCVEPETGVDRSKKVLVDFTNHICDNNAQNFVEFINDGALDCIQEKQMELATCTTRLSQTQGARTAIKLSEACGEFEAMSDCVLTTLNTCPKRSTAKFMSKIFQIIDTNSRCRIADPDMKIHVHKK